MSGLWEDAMEERIVIIDYTNWRGERRERRILPKPATLRFTETPHHKPAQWVIDAYDVEKSPPVPRTFALNAIHSWRTA